MLKHPLESAAPILLFVYNRLDTLKLTVKALQQNKGADESPLFIFSDGYKSEIDKKMVLEVREFISDIKGFKSLKVFESDQNLGLAKSIISGVTKIIQEYGKVIVLEDDLVTSTNFIAYMNNCLEFYKDKLQVFSISGYTPPVKADREIDFYFTKRASSWGWASWVDRWTPIDWEVKDYKDFKEDGIQQSNFNNMGTDLCKMLSRQMQGKTNSWAIRWVYHQFKYNLFTAYPVVSKVKNIGTSGLATHTRDNFNRFKTNIDKSGKMDFNFPESIGLKDFYTKQFLNSFSVLTRLKYKLLNYFFS